MSTLPIQSGNPLQQLAQSLMQTYDTNSDGKLSTDEFSVLLSRLTQSLSSTTAAVASSGGASTATGATTPVLLSAVPTARLNGFDAGKIADTTHATPKYCFARVAQQADLSSVRDKGTAETLLRSLIPRFQAAGLNVLDVQGDKIKIAGDAGDEWIDVIQGANSGAPAFQWSPV